jgi:hypothetical protein
MSISQGIFDTANAIGMKPLDLATIMSYETGGTFDPKKKGPITKWGQHRGLIQFGEPQAKQYGVDWNNPINSQLGANGAVAKYFQSSGWKPGMSLMNAYSIVNAGAPGKFNASDANNGGAPGTVADKVLNQFAPHRAKAEMLLADSGQIMTDAQYNDAPTRQSFRDFRAQRSGQTQSAQPNIPEGGFAAFRAKQQEARGQKVDFDFSLKDGLTATITDAPPKPKDDQNFLQHTGAGIARGLKDLPGGLAEIAGRVDESDNLRGMFDSIPMPDFLNEFRAKNHQREHDAIQSARDWNAADEAEYQAKHGDSGFATAGRIGGNVATAFVPGTGQMTAAKSITSSLAAGKTGMALLKGAGLGAAQGAVLGTQSADDSIVNNAALGAGFGALGTAAGVGVGKLLGNDVGRRLVQSADGNAGDLLSRLRSGNVEYVDGAGVTTAQAAQLPGISQALRAIKNRGVAGGAGPLLDKETMQNVARLNAVRSIADPSGMTSIEAAERAGGQISDQFTAGRKGMRADTSAIYKDPALQESMSNGIIGGGVDAYNDGYQAMGRQVGGNADLKTISEVLDSGTEIPFPELQKLYQRAGSIERQAGSGINPDTTTAHVAKQLRDIMNQKMEGNSLFEDAKAAKKAEVNTYGKGWVSGVTRNGTDGMPVLSGAEIAKKAFSPATAQAENIALFNKAANQGGGDAGDASRKALKDYAIADMLETSAKSGGDDLVLNPSAAKWMDKRSEALGGLLSPNEMSKMQGVGDDLKRYASSEDMGGVRGSATAQNQELLRLGLLDSSLWKIGAKTPLAGMALDYLSDVQRTALTKNLAKAMADPKTAEAAIQQYMRMQSAAPAMGLLGGVSAPAGMGLLQ